MPWSSNATFVVTLTLGDETGRAIYKPHRGERPLWDFPDGLYRREVAAFVLAEALGWSFVPETIIREDAPVGIGSLQRFIDVDYDEHYFTLLEDATHHDALRRMCTFDLVANNADRKGGHCLLDGDGKIWGIDHGLCFNAEPHLRTVIWDFAGEEIPPHLRADVGRVAAELPVELHGLLGRDEIEALVARLAAVSRLDRFPDPGHDRRPYPWPLV
jgi:uncharacterized repeat protein (TIGR03843 family)